MQTNNNKMSKKLEILGAILGGIVATVVSLTVAQMKISHPLVVIAILAFPMLGIIGLDYLNDKKREKMSIGSWDIEDVVKRSEYDVYNPKISPFGIAISIILSYVVVYFSEVLNLVINEKKIGNPASFSELFTYVSANILKIDGVGKYLIQYWIFLTFMIVVFLGTTIFVILKNKKK